MPKQCDLARSLYQGGRRLADWPIEKDTYVQQMKQRGVFDGPALYDKYPNNLWVWSSTSMST